MSVRILTGDCHAILPTLAADSVDCVVTDPPYNVGCNYEGSDDARPPDVYLDMMRDVLGQCARVSRDGVVFFPGRANLLDVTFMLADTGLRVHHLLGWRRREFAGDVYSHGHPAVSWEPIVWTTKQAIGQAYCTRIYGHAGRDFLDVASVRRTERAHPCPKSLEVLKWLVQLVCPPGGIVLDPFAGTGTTGEAAIALGRHAILIEIHPPYVALSERRCAQGGLFAQGVGA